MKPPSSVDSGDASLHFDDDDDDASFVDALEGEGLDVGSEVVTASAQAAVVRAHLLTHTRRKSSGHVCTQAHCDRVRRVCQEGWQEKMPCFG